ncbi:MAG: hypothetical protein OES69_04665 [Myxococcales bacterium]|jgi:hypothetical protein|nr:hypothetical protein [Myxococcales bacterium]MDH3843206.1 hypothetical protein [Myxococcales bacterium]
MSSFDVWVIRFSPGGAPPSERLKNAFGIDDASARSLEQNLPRVVKHGVPAKEAGEMRKVLESIGAVVECRPARDPKPSAGPGPAVFQRPAEDLLPGRMSAIDPFAPAARPDVPRISVDDPVAPRPPATKSDVSGVLRPSSLPPPGSVDQLIRAKSRDQQRRVFLKQAVGTILAGVAILAIGWFMGTSVLRGDAGWVGIAFDGVGIYFLGVGVWDLFTTLRS